MSDAAKPFDVLIIGAGGLGTPAAWAVAAAGVGRIAIVDDDTVDVTNLHRQVLFDDADVGRPKAAALAAALAAHFALVRALPIARRFDDASAAELVAQARVVIDGSDNLPTKFLANDACVRAATPLVHGAALGWGGQFMVVRAGGHPCYRCLFEALPAEGTADSCAEAGIAGPVAGVVGAAMGVEAVRLLRQPASQPESDPERLARLHRYDAPHGFRTVSFRPNPSCAACASPASGS